MSRFRPGQVVLFMVATDPRLVVAVGQPVRVLQTGIREGQRLGVDASGDIIAAGADFDCMVELAGGLWRGLAQDWQLADMDGPPAGPTRHPEPA